MVTQKRAIGEGTRVVGTRPGALAFGQIATVIVLGVIFWFSAAMAVRFGGPAGFFGPTASVIAFVVVIPACWLAVLFTKRVAKLGAGQTIPGVVVGAVTATFCDGIGLTWGNGLYGTDPVMTTFGAAWILWGVGLFLLFAYVENQRQARATRRGSCLCRLHAVKGNRCSTHLFQPPIDSNGRFVFPADAPTVLVAPQPCRGSSGPIIKGSERCR